ncbi:MAG: sigma-70 family RNA polymerase sigma factor [Clostridiales bacterium]|nr:sigma-70 family RNA polymerase sigma factor [Clostridiales bacterium]
MIFLFSSVAEGISGNKDSNGIYEGLIAEMATGSIQALELLYQETKTAVYGFALSIIKNPQDAEDIAQDTYVRVFQAAKSYNPRGKPMAWILTITRNFSLMKLRRNPEATFEDYTIEHGIQDFSENTIDRIVLKTAFRVLSDEEKQIVMLHSVAGLKHREIAEIMKIPLSTALSKYRRALSKLKKELREEKP